MESIGIPVSRGDLSIERVDEFYSTPVHEGWRKPAPYVKDLRQEVDSPQTWEWYQWLHERLREYHERIPRIPAHVRKQLRWHVAVVPVKATRLTARTDNNRRKPGSEFRLPG